MLVLYPNRHHILTADEHTSYRQQADFLCYTHIAAPECRAIIVDDTKHIFIPDRDEKKILREGELITESQVVTLNPGAIVYPLSRWEEVLTGLYTGGEITTNLSYLNYDTGSEMQSLHDLLGVSSEQIVPLSQEYREIKTPDEIAKIRKAQQITLEAIEYATQDIKSGMYEYEIAAKLSYYYASHGATDSFPPIVASGHNACVLHYHANHSQIQAGDVLLIDTGAYVDGYCGDCSRSTIVAEWQSSESSKVAKSQKLLEIVKNVHDACVAYVRPGLTMKQVHEYAVQQFELLFAEQGRERRSEYFPHGIGHSIGLDVHDPLSKNRPLEVGMCITIEPGLYIPELSLGIRWENIVVLTEGGCELFI